VNAISLNERISVNVKLGKICQGEEVAYFMLPSYNLLGRTGEGEAENWRSFTS
jgi:hypothetical protein